MEVINHGGDVATTREATLDFWLVAPDGGILMEWSEDPRPGMATAAAREVRLEELLGDLFRCEHGRKAGDDCLGCGGASKGGPLQGKVVGHTMGGREIVLPEGPWWDHLQPADWRRGPES